VQIIESASNVPLKIPSRITEPEVVLASTVETVAHEQQEAAAPENVLPVESVPEVPAAPSFFDLLGPKVFVPRAAL
jgi:hypothetical protein